MWWRQMSRLIVLCWLLLACVVWRTVPLPSTLAPRHVRRRWTRFYCPWPGRFGFAIDVRLVVLTR